MTSLKSFEVHVKYLISVLFLLTGVSCMHQQVKMGSADGFPVATVKDHSLEKHGFKRNDPYYWLRERENPDVIKYLEAENAYTERVMKPGEKLKETVFEEMKSRMKEDESSAPIRRGDYYYWARYVPGKQYPVWLRAKGSPTGPEEVLIDENALSVGHPYFQCSGPMMSPNQKLMVYGCDTVGRRFYTLYVKELSTGKMLDVKIENVVPNMSWAADNETFFYTRQNPETLRSEKIFRYNIRTHKTDLVYFEKDETYSVYLSKSLSKKFIYINSNATLSTEVRYLAADHPTGEFKVFQKREKEHEYSVEDGETIFYVVTNSKAKNFRVMTAPLTHTDKTHWKEILPHRTDAYVTDLTVFKNHLVITERREGLNHLVIRDRNADSPHEIPFNDSSYVVYQTGNVEYDAPEVRYEYMSMRTPETTFDYDFAKQTAKVVKVQDIPNYDSSKYKTERIWVTARDGKKVPVSLLMRKDAKTDGSHPLLVYGYGSYGASMDAWFSGNIFSLVDRGFVYARTHIRGGSELGREWYDSGRTHNKLNTFYDFIDVTEALVKLGYGDKDRVFAQGGSAGGLLMGAVMNMRPDLYKGMVAEVPFVDVITTMLDDTIPLTTSEYDEWGNPNEKADFDYIMKYSPYDNVTKKAYPNLLVTTGLHDSQVQYWEPAKWVAKLRQNNTAKTTILLKTDMSSGHGGASGRYDALKDDAIVYAFMIMLAN